RWSVDDIRLVDQIEADLRAKCFVIPAAGHLTEAAADVGGAVMGPEPVAIASAVDIVDQLNSKIRIARKCSYFCKAIRLALKARRLNLVRLLLSVIVVLYHLIVGSAFVG